jgi:ABC-type transport system involved in multi-copper enzyme maturation permease subunit
LARGEARRILDPRARTCALVFVRPEDGLFVAPGSEHQSMLPGPVFNVELLTTARRARYFVLRLLYGLLLLGLITITFLESPSYSRWGLTGGQASIQEMASLAEGFFIAFASTQAAMVLLLTPALVAGTIVDEKQRKTLHYLLASPLTSAEIVLGKLCARLLHLGVFLGVGLPILSLMTLFGGIDPWIIAAVYAATLSVAFFLAGVAIYVSTIARKVREAVALVYLIELAWLSLPPLIDQLVSNFWPALYPWVAMVNNWLLYSTPIGIAIVAGRAGMKFSAGWFFWMIGLQLGMGLAFAGLAVLRLRRIFRTHDEASGSRARSRSRWKSFRLRLLPRRACGTDAMLWKELHVSRTSGRVKLLALILALAFGGLLLWSLIDPVSRASNELGLYGYSFTTVSEYSARYSLNWTLRFWGTAIYVLLVLGVAANAATCVSSEREADTWTSLTSTPLPGTEILRAKMLGAVWSMRWLWSVLILLWIFGLSLGAVHPAGFLFCALELVVFVAFAAAFGTFLSLRSKTSLRAQVATIGALVVLNGGYLLCCIPAEPDSPLVAAGCTPFIMAVSLISFGEVSGLGATPAVEGKIALTCLVGTLIYALGAFGLAVTACEGFDRAIDRPRRDRPARTRLPEV